jgi:hypothetical protein
MGPLDILWHGLNFVAPALGVAAIAAAAVKLLWRTVLRDVSWHRLAGWSAIVGTAALCGGMVVFGRDGKMASYAAMLLGCALSLWAVGFGWGRR